MTTTLDILLAFICSASSIYLPFPQVHLKTTVKCPDIPSDSATHQVEAVVAPTASSEEKTNGASVPQMDLTDDSVRKLVGDLVDKLVDEAEGDEEQNVVNSAEVNSDKEKTKKGDRQTTQENNKAADANNSQSGNF